MTTEAVYDEAEPVQTYSPAPQPLLDIYSNSAELNLIDVEYSNTGDCMQTSDAGTQPGRPSDTTDGDQEDNISNNCSSTSGDGINCQDDVIEQLDAEKREGSYVTPSQEPWKLKLRNNWKRHLRRKAAAADKNSKKSDNRYTLGGSLSRLVGILSQCFTVYRTGITG